MKNKPTLLIAGLALSVWNPHVQALAGVDADSLSSTQQQPVEWLYGDSIEFDIIRNGSRVGSHNVTFERSDEGLSVVTDFQLEVGALFMTFFELTYRSEALWRDGQLFSLFSRTDRNGEVSTVEAEVADGVLRGEGPNGSFTAPLGVYPTNHWNAGVKDSTQLINTITGRVSDVRLVPINVEEVQTERGLVEATRYKYDGAIENEIWYDQEGRWVRMQFPGGDGSLVELHCRKCFPSQVAEVPNE
jgi:Domain of unknown function (DUF6134)